MPLHKRRGADQRGASSPEFSVVLAQTPEAEGLAAALLREVPLPARAAADALHIAVAAVNGVAYLVTWNCTHIANATLRPRMS